MRTQLRRFGNYLAVLELRPLYFHFTLLWEKKGVETVHIPLHVHWGIVKDPQRFGWWIFTAGWLFFARNVDLDAPLGVNIKLDLWYDKAYWKKYKINYTESIRRLKYAVIVDRESRLIVKQLIQKTPF